MNRIRSLAILAAFSLPAQAAVVSPTGATLVVGSSLENFGYGLAQTYGGSFVSSLGDAPAGAAGNFVSGNSAPDYFASQPPLQIVYDLGADTDLALVYFWASTAATAGGGIYANAVSEFTLAFNTEAEGDTSFTGPTINLTPGNGGPAPSPGVSTSFQLFPIPPTTARYVKMTLTDNYRGTPGGEGGDRVGFNEIAFDTVPEPSAALLGGFGVLALLRRRRA